MKVYRAGAMVSVVRVTRSLIALACGMVVAALGGPTTLAWAQEFPQGTVVTAIGFYDAKGSERLVTVILHPVGNGAQPPLVSGPRITRRVLGTGKPEQFAPTVRGMKRKVLVDKGRLRAAVYFVSVVDGDYANVVSYLVGGNQIVVDDPANLKPAEGGGSGDGGGGGGGGGGGSH